MLPKGVEGQHSYCELCDEQGTITCGNCHLIVCRECKEIYGTDSCSATKGEHLFVHLKDGKRQQIKSVDPKASSSQQHAKRNQGFDDEDKDWSCTQCTFLNPADHKICAMCAKTRRVDPVELPQARSRVCRRCTYHNKENATICKACLKTLDLQNLEMSV